MKRIGHKKKALLLGPDQDVVQFADRFQRGNSTSGVGRNACSDCRICRSGRTFRAPRMTASLPLANEISHDVIDHGWYSAENR